MCDNLISYPTEEFSKLIFVTKTLLHRHYEAFENSNTVIKGLSSHLWKIYLNAIFCAFSWLPSRITLSLRGGFRSGLFELMLQIVKYYRPSKLWLVDRRVNCWWSVITVQWSTRNYSLYLAPYCFSNVESITDIRSVLSSTLHSFWM